MGVPLQKRILFFLARQLHIWYVPDDIPSDRVAEEAIKQWGNPSAALTNLLQEKALSTNGLYAACLLWRRIKPGDPVSDPQTLRRLLEPLPTGMQADAFRFAVNDDRDRAAFLLIRFLWPALPGLVPVARCIVEFWSSSGRCDDLALDFYQSLLRYDAPEEYVHWLIARALVARTQYAEAESLLLRLIQSFPSPDIWWHLVLVFQALHRPVQQQLWALYSFIRNAPADSRTEQALKSLGHLHRELLSMSTTLSEAS